MPCYHPIPAFQKAREPPRLHPPKGTANLALPCQTCIGCRTARATQWAHRCTHEASKWEYNSFITLTYDDEHLPNGGHLDLAALQKFLKRLRAQSGRHRESINCTHRTRIRYFAAGEYGEANQRPHYHAILFNCAFRDTTRVAEELRESDILRKIWPYGDHKIGDVTPATASYIAQYSLKKQGKYLTYNPETGEAGRWEYKRGTYRPAPFLRMSLKPGIGQDWLEKYSQDLTHGYLVADGRRHSIPRYYLKKLEATDEQFHAEILYNKQKHRLLTPTDANTPERLADAEKIHHRRKQLSEQRKL